MSKIVTSPGGAAVGGAVGAGSSGGGSAGGGALPSVPPTEIVPAISGWMVQKYENVPGVSNVRWNVPPAMTKLESNMPARSVTVWGRAPVLDHVTVAPAVTVFVAGV